jgi:hypothetical protein
MGEFFTPGQLKISFLTIVFSFAGQAWLGQILDLSPVAFKALNRQRQKEAARLGADYKDSGQAIENFNFSKGAAASQQVRVAEEPAEYVFDQERDLI